MTNYDVRLKELQQKAARKSKLEASLAELFKQREELNARAEELKEIMFTEKEDVERLENGLSGIFAGIMGNKEEKLDKERAEALAARGKYEAAQRALAEVEANIKAYGGELLDLKGVDEEYRTLLKEKSEAVKAAGGEEGNEIFRMEERAAFLESQIQELEEAATAGRILMGLVINASEHLDSASTLGVLDMLGGGLIVDFFKHDNINKAKSVIYEIQSQLGRFRTELADVSIDEDLNIEIGEFATFADYFFDDIFSAWAIQDKVKSANAKMSVLRKNVYDILEQLSEMKENAEQELAKLRIELDNVIEGMVE